MADIGNGHREADIIIDGQILSAAQSMTLRVALETFAMSLQEGLGDDAHGINMASAYLARVVEIRKFMGVV